MVLGDVVETCVTVVTIVNYCAQCELLIFYLREIGLRMEEKTKDLSIIMKVCASTSRFTTTLVSVWNNAPPTPPPNRKKMLQLMPCSQKLCQRYSIISMYRL